VERELLANGWGLKSQHSLTLEKFAIQYLEDSKARKAYNSFRTDRDALKAFQKSTGEILLDGITVDHIERFRIESLGRVKPSSVNVALRHLKAAFNWAVRRGFISANPAAQTKLNRVPKNTHLRYLDGDEIQRIREAIGSNLVLRRIVDPGLWTGLRRNEIVHLQWSDIDLRDARPRFRARKTSLQNRFSDQVPRLENSPHQSPAPRDACGYEEPWRPPR
jgi:integrase